MGQSMPWPAAVMPVGPGHPVARTTSGHGTKVRLRSNLLPPAHVKEQPQFLAEGRIQAAVDKGVVAGGARSQPVETEVESIGGRDGVAGQQHHVAVEREPADGEDPHDQQQHGQSSPPLFPLGCTLSRRGVADGVVTPQPARHCGVRGSDDEERQHVKKYEGEEVNVLPVHVRWFWKVWDTQAALLFFTGVDKGGKDYGLG